MEETLLTVRNCRSCCATMDGSKRAIVIFAKFAILGWITSNNENKLHVKVFFEIRLCCYRSDDTHSSTSSAFRLSMSSVHVPPKRATRGPPRIRESQSE